METVLRELGLTPVNPGAYCGEWLKCSTGRRLKSVSPIDGKVLAEIDVAGPVEYEKVTTAAQSTFEKWRMVPAPKRGMVILEISQALRQKKEALGKLVTLETGKILPEGLGEVQESIDIADFAVGLSRQLYGKTMHSERPGHRMYEQWHPLGLVGVITAFNFPQAVWAWNAMIAAICGDVLVWKPSEQTPLTAIATTKICGEIAAKHGFAGLFSLVVGDGPELGQKMALDSSYPLVSATGSCRMGKSVAENVARRFGRSLLELGGNNAIVIMDDADLDLVVRGALFGAVGTAGQRCTSIRRMLVQKGVEKQFVDRLVKSYRQVKIGNPMESGVLMGPLINEGALEIYRRTIKEVKQLGLEILCGGKELEGLSSNLYVEPTIVKVAKVLPLLKEERFVPISYIVPIETLEEAIQINNDVPQGLSSAIFTRNLRHAEQFLSQAGSDCGIANVNIGTSGAEIGGAFGGEKETGGGREAGSDSWKQYMRRQTVTINYSSELPLAQGIKFGE